MVVQVRKSFRGGDMSAWFSGLQSRIESRVREDMVEALRLAESSMADFIASRPTAWMAENMGKSGRVETGLMHDSVSSRLFSVSRGKIVGGFGWLDTQRPYFLSQEYGGKNTFTGGDIEAMYAKADASLVMWEYVTKWIGDSIRGA